MEKEEEERKKKTRGRQRIEMKMIDDKDNRLISFSKRRSGIYKKANELGILCGAHSVVVIFSQSLKPFSFGCPTVKSVARRFLDIATLPHDPHSTDHLVEACRHSRIQLLINHHNRLSDHLHLQKKRAASLAHERKKAKNKGGGVRWWEKVVDDMSMDEATRMGAAVQEIHDRIVCRVNELRNAPLKPSSSNYDYVMLNNKGDGGADNGNMPYFFTSCGLGVPSFQ